VINLKLTPASHFQKTGC